MITKQEIVHNILKQTKVYNEQDKTKLKLNLLNKKSTAYAPSNIALCKYWGKRNLELNLPVTSSLSLSLGNKGATTTVGLHISEHSKDRVILNGAEVDETSDFYLRLVKYLDLFRSSTNIKTAPALLPFTAPAPHTFAAQSASSNSFIKLFILSGTTLIEFNNL